MNTNDFSAHTLEKCHKIATTDSFYLVSFSSNIEFRDDIKDESKIVQGKFSSFIL